jgi:DNA-directed RNA polymerase specialized sigma24 family protein
MTLVIKRPRASIPCPGTASRTWIPGFRRTAIFLPRSDLELAGMSDEGLLRYAAEAKRANAPEPAQQAMWHLLFRDEGRVRARVALKLPAHLRHHRDVVATWVLERVFDSALKLQLRGESIGEFRRYCNIVVDRQYVSFWRTQQGKAIENETELPGYADDGDAGRDLRGGDLDVDALVRRVELREVVEVVTGRLSHDHAAIVRRAIWDDQASKDVAAEFGTSAANVDQITSRFRRELRAECERRGVRW